MPAAFSALLLLFFGCTPPAGGPPSPVTPPPPADAAPPPASSPPASPPAAAPPAALPLQVFQSAPAGPDTLVLLDDARLTDPLREEGWPFGGVPLDAEGTARWQAFAATPLVHAVLRLVAADGHVSDEAILAQPLARLAPAGLPGVPSTWAVTEDWSVGMGAYNGPITAFVQVRDGKLHWVEATGGSRHGRLELLASLKSAWRVDPKNGTDILHVVCRPDETGGEFVVAYERLHYAAGGFTATEREEPGWLELETEASFPPQEKFPG